MHLIRRVLSLLAPVASGTDRAPAPPPERSQEPPRDDVLAAYMPRGEVVRLADYRNGRQ